MSEFIRPKRAVALSVLVGLGFLTGACDGSEKETINSCTAAPLDAWQKMPVNLNAEGIAQKLDVSAADVRNGSYGPATCESPVSPTDIDMGVSRITVENIGSTCMAIGLAGPPTAPQKAVIAACAAEGTAV